MTFGELIRSLRERAGLSMGQLARASGVRHTARVSEIEAGADPSITRARDIAGGLGLTLTEVVAAWEGIELTRVRGTGRLAALAPGSIPASGSLSTSGGVSPTPRAGEFLPTDIPEPRLFAGLISAWELTPAHRRKELVAHVMQYAAGLNSTRETATGTDPKE